MQTREVPLSRGALLGARNNAIDLVAPSSEENRLVPVSSGESVTVSDYRHGQTQGLMLSMQLSQVGVAQLACFEFDRPIQVIRPAGWYPLDSLRKHVPGTPGMGGAVWFRGNADVMWNYAHVTPPSQSSSTSPWRGWGVLNLASTTGFVYLEQLVAVPFSSEVTHTIPGVSISGDGRLRVGWCICNRPRGGVFPTGWTLRSPASPSTFSTNSEGRIALGTIAQGEGVHGEASLGHGTINHAGHVYSAVFAPAELVRVGQVFALSMPDYQFSERHQEHPQVEASTSVEAADVYSGRADVAAQVAATTSAKDDLHALEHGAVTVVALTSVREASVPVQRLYVDVVGLVQVAHEASQHMDTVGFWAVASTRAPSNAHFIDSVTVFASSVAVASEASIPREGLVVTSVASVLVASEAHTEPEAPPPPPWEASPDLPPPPPMGGRRRSSRAGF